MKNPESLRYYMFATTFFIFTFMNEEYFNSSYLQLQSLSSIPL